MSAVSAMSWVVPAYSVSRNNWSASSNAAEFVLPLFKVVIAKGWDEVFPTNHSGLVNH